MNLTGDQIKLSSESNVVVLNLIPTEHNEKFTVSLMSNICLFQSSYCMPPSGTTFWGDEIFCPILPHPMTRKGRIVLWVRLLNLSQGSIFWCTLFQKFICCPKTHLAKKVTFLAWKATENHLLGWLTFYRLEWVEFYRYQKSKVSFDKILLLDQKLDN